MNPDKNFEGNKTNDQAPEALPKLLTYQEVATFLRVDKSTVCRYTKTGKLRCYRVEGRVLFRQSDVALFFENSVDQKCAFGKD